MENEQLDAAVHPPASPDPGKKVIDALTFLLNYVARSAAEPFCSKAEHRLAELETVFPKPVPAAAEEKLA